MDKFGRENKSLVFIGIKFLFFVSLFPKKEKQKRKKKRMKKYNILYLLKKQPIKLTKTNDFQTLISIFNASTELKKAHFNRKCYSIINNCKISYQNLERFYKIFRLPKNSFFPLFFKLKKDYLNQKVKKRDEIKKYIFEKMNILPDNIKKYIRNLAKYEINIIKSKKIKVWSKILYPKTKKQANLILNYKKKDWILLFDKFSEEIKKEYKNTDEKYLQKLISLFILDLDIKKYSLEEINKQYRILSKKYHPDLGGNSYDFNLLQKARSVFFN
ncbi:MAG: hypothetical protein A2086_13640 [Spirochaetes bacterium GWD1_27_9]|nr:MAG: hypothetical protein A2Z98_02495 [Spirochaetes bacterium GWB1_27_13]OHD30701.1 MAG: hypothetical protein A2086_13640 [Spirochaetes bacterium GWD1_27_9]